MVYRRSMVLWRHLLLSLRCYVGELSAKLLLLSWVFTISLPAEHLCLSVPTSPLGVKNRPKTPLSIALWTLTAAFVIVSFTPMVPCFDIGLSVMCYDRVMADFGIGLLKWICFSDGTLFFCFSDACARHWRCALIAYGFGVGPAGLRFSWFHPCSFVFHFCAGILLWEYMDDTVGLHWFTCSRDPGVGAHRIFWRHWKARRVFIISEYYFAVMSLFLSLGLMKYRTSFWKMSVRIISALFHEQWGALVWFLPVSCYYLLRWCKKDQISRYSSPSPNVSLVLTGGIDLALCENFLSRDGIL